MKAVNCIVQLIIFSFLTLLGGACRHNCPMPMDDEVVPDLNYSLRFDGVDDYAEALGYDSVNLIGKKNFTIEARIKANSIQDFFYPAIVSTRDINENGIILFLGIGSASWEGGRPWVNIQGINYPCTTCISATDDKVHHIAVERVGNIIYFYMDGVFMHQRDILSPGDDITSTGNIQIGHDFPNPLETYFKGEISEVRIWSHARGAAINAYKDKQVSPSSPGLVGYWRMDEGSGQKIINKAYNSQDAILGFNNSSDDCDPKWLP